MVLTSLHIYLQPKLLVCIMHVAEQKVHDICLSVAAFMYTDVCFVRTCASARERLHACLKCAYKHCNARQHLRP